MWRGWQCTCLHVNQQLVCSDCFKQYWDSHSVSCVVCTVYDVLEVFATVNWQVLTSCSVGQNTLDISVCQWACGSRWSSSWAWSRPKQNWSGKNLANFINYEIVPDFWCCSFWFPMVSYSLDAAACCLHQFWRTVGFCTSYLNMEHQWMSEPM